jgi:pyruvate ferredoxin oxidoreductase gamma subunit
VNELLLVGRGGEGVVVASQILAETLARAGFWVQSFPEFTAERRGAPISAFLRWDDGGRIRRRYKMRGCDVLAVVSPSPPSIELLRRVRPGGLVIVNREARLPIAGDFAIVHVPAARIARAAGTLSAEGRPMGNAAVVGACVRLVAPDSLPVLQDAVAARLGAANAAAATAGFEQCRRQRRLPADAVVDAAGAEPVRAAPQRRFSNSTRDTLANRTGDWSLERPILGAACTACALCALFCPETAMTRHDGSMAIDYVHCKGCGICVAVCPVRDAITMEEVPA